MYPGHPNLLPAYFDDPSSIDSKGAMDANKWVSKPLYGREGIGILHSKNYTSFKGFSEAIDKNFGFGADKKPMGKSIFQLYHKLPEIQGRVI